MALHFLEEQKGKLLIVSVKDKLTKEDYETFAPEVERLIKLHGKIRILLDMHDFHGWTAGALWEDIKFSVQHFRDIERLALVGEKKWEKGMATFCKPFTTAEVRFFDRAEAAKAREWIEADLAGVEQKV